MEASSYYPSTAIQEELEVSLQSAATYNSVSFTLVGIQSILNPTEEDLVLEDIYLATLADSVVFNGQNENFTD